MNMFSISHASIYDNFRYKEGTKLYKQESITKGKKHLTKHTAKKNYATRYQIVKMSKGKIVLRPQKGWYLSADPYFKKKKLTYKLSPKCKFYYRNAAYPMDTYKKVSKKNVMNYMKENKSSYGHLYEVSGKHYCGGYFGDVYVKNGKVAAILMDGGD